MGTLLEDALHGWPRPLHRAPAAAGSEESAGSRRALAAATLAAGILLVVYGLTLAPDLTWANGALDGGELITAAVTLGIPHPPGYPTYVVLGKLFSWLPIGTLAFRLNLLSAVTIAVAAGIVAAGISRRANGPAGFVVAVAGGLTVGLLPPIWRQATVAEVYGLNLLFVAAFAYCLSRRRSTAGGLFFGLALTAHLSSVLLLPMAIVITPRREWGRLLLGTAVGLAPILLLPGLAGSGSPVVWGDPRSLTGWWWLVSGQLYSANITWPAAAASWGLARPYLWLAPVLIGFGLVAPLLISHRSGTRPAASWAAGLTIASYGVLALIYGTPDAYVILLPALLLAVALVFSHWPLPPAAAVLIPTILLMAGFNTQNLRHQTAVRPLAEAALAQAPAEAILLAPGDRTIFTLWYFHHAEGQRPDLMLVDENLLAFEWYRTALTRRYPALLGLAEDDVAQFIALNGATKPLCTVGLVNRPAQPAPSGYTYRLGSDGHPPFLICQELNP